ncbi:hypothetical protein RHGRI_006708 [Rhododendron griersonianum]|uniref:Uncharacterized protein n=1 Tax=Rhododendron griersonianum TaxID=479676 RepID=A0AAV6KV91_9ERIC|nr:hypothetical protein RHGRI_006708 [Rhododendron griersonianum]
MITAFVFLHRRLRFPSLPPSFGFVAVVIIYLIIFKQNWKPIKKKKEEVKIMKKEVEKFQYRSSMVSFVKLLKNIKFTETQKKEIKKSPFSSLILAIADAQWDDAYFKKSDHDALKLVEQYEGHEGQRGRFKLGAIGEDNG